ncbi:XylR N-terminal domain-containing protein [Metabacillus arenae]|uniref:XylR N-terminal domain-containing protein n=1 Tax=Metabacillus arenae TaxID=2771434 RepID=A0A926NPS4_9BACI|nr:XylR N-terminal domain-containing protein [Metabacillus arenae]MBD1381696.1 XylR N-terminal domain-containing protein [Metabacillus arenae]
MAIKANTNTLGDLFSMNPKKDDFLQSHRMFISSADAWGTLIKDLVLALGIERAKRFLLRYGYQCGRHEALMLKDMFNWENKKEWIMAGVKMHSLFGRTSSVPIKVHIDTESQEFDVEGYWNQSYEAKQYLQHFPIHSEPVCYFLEGYASGYCSTSLGKKVVFKEVECIGKGDPHCHFIGKTLDLWGDEISPELVDYEREDIRDELDQAHKRIERQSEILKKGNLLSNQLTQIVLQGNGLDSIAQILGRSLKCGIVISNKDFETLSEYGDIQYYSLKNIIENKEKLDLSDQDKINEMLKQRTTTIQLNLLKELGFSHYPLITPIIVQNRVYGYISIIKNSKEMEELESSFAERAANICALHILNEKTAIDTEQRMKGELLHEVLLKPNLDSNITKKLSYLGYRINKPHYVFIFNLQNQSYDFQNDEFVNDEKEVIMNSLRKYSFSIAGENILISHSFGQIQALVSVDLLKACNMSEEKFGISILKEVKRKFPSAQLLIGISNICPSIHRTHEGYKQAKKALEIAQINKKQQVFLFSTIGHISILLDARNPQELDNYANSVLGPIYDYDLQKSSGLLKTIYFYLNNECNLHKTARILNLSIGGMRYRLTNLKERFNIDMMNSTTRREVQMALDIYVAFGKLTALLLNQDEESFE